jgi:hypothetical protein
MNDALSVRSYHSSRAGIFPWATKRRCALLQKFSCFLERIYGPRAVGLPGKGPLAWLAYLLQLLDYDFVASPRSYVPPDPTPALLFRS